MKKFEYHLPLIIKDTLGEEIYKQMSEYCASQPNERELVIYGSAENIKNLEDTFEKAAEEWISKKYTKS